jgi:hypothetical protein
MCVSPVVAPPANVFRASGSGPGERGGWREASLRTGVSCDLGQVGVEVRSQRGVQARLTVLGAEHEVDDDEAPDCGMAAGAWGGLSALHLFCGMSWAVGPGWDGARLWRWDCVNRLVQCYVTNE